MATINETAIKTPGVYINEIPLFPPSVAQVATAIPAFIGYTGKATEKVDNDLHLVPKRISSMVEYETYFGKARNESITINISGNIDANPAGATVAPITPPGLTYRMYYAMRMYFANGGGPCYIVSVDLDTVAIDVGDDTKGLQGGLKVLEKEDEPTIIVFPDGVGLGDKDKYYGLIDLALDQCETLADRVTLVDVYQTSGNNDAANIKDLRDKVRSEREYVMYGMAYHPWLETNLPFTYTGATAVIGTHTGPGATDLAGKKLDDVNASNNALYNLIKAELDKLHVVLPPSSSIAGIYARVDGNRGVWKAPANVNVMNVVKPLITYSDRDQEDMNIDPTSGKSINAIRAFTGKGILVWGARTLAGNDNEWRYVSVRRFFNMVEESTKKASAQFVFEPNDANTWVKVRAMIENYLTVLWRQGALAGAKPEHAFFVKIGLGQTMTADDILNGKMIVEIGMAAVRPAEFIILRFMHKMQES
ncbi:phage tail sheath family protein [Botryobacter ruber]|uniref:phage tail sheath family protein n=1 Tax=Botryobacter ruber TaxID=2171629 RepID=UPI000E0BD361|nr:phage tail sheath C-terminal domain-containing protein [Botryobacter ruber]